MQIHRNGGTSCSNIVIYMTFYPYAGATGGDTAVFTWNFGNASGGGGTDTGNYNVSNGIQALISKMTSTAYIEFTYTATITAGAFSSNTALAPLLFNFNYKYCPN